MGTTSQLREAGHRLKLRKELPSTRKGLPEKELTFQKNATENAPKCTKALRAPLLFDCGYGYGIIMEVDGTTYLYRERVIQGAIVHLHGDSRECTNIEHHLFLFSPCVSLGRQNLKWSPVGRTWPNHQTGTPGNSNHQTMWTSSCRWTLSSCRFNYCTSKVVGNCPSNLQAPIYFIDQHHRSPLIELAKTSVTPGLGASADRPRHLGRTRVVTWGLAMNAGAWC